MDRRGCRKHLPTGWDSSMILCIEYSLGICVLALFAMPKKTHLESNPEPLGKQELVQLPSK